MSGLPLEGIRVVEFAHMMQGPWAGEMLADLGADVIKVEAPGTGERGRQSGTIFAAGHSAQFLAMNRNKRSICLDLKSEEGHEAAVRLIRTADVLIQNFRPGVLDRLGLGWEVAHELNPRLVYCSATGYGSGAPDPRRPGQDLLAQARTGAAWLTGRASEPPTATGPFVADVHAATMLAQGALAALLARERGGEGRHVTVDLVGAMLHQITQEVVSQGIAGVEPERADRGGSAYLEGAYGMYETADQRWLAISLTPAAQLATALGEPQLAAYQDKHSETKHRTIIGQLVAAQIALLTFDEAMSALEAADVWVSPVNSMAQMREDPYVDWEGRKLVVDHPEAGTVELVGNPIAFDGQRLPLRLAPPLIGADTDDLLNELGLA